MSEKRRGLGRGLGALIPSTPPTGASRPTDVFFKDNRAAQAATEALSSASRSGPSPLSTQTGDGAPAATEEARFTGNGMGSATANRAEQSPTVEARHTGAPDRDNVDHRTGEPEPGEGFTGNDTTESVDPVDPDGVDAEQPHPDSVVAAARAEATSAGLDDASTHSGTAEQADPAARRALDENENDRGAEDGLAPVPGATFAEVPVTGIRPNPRQPRQVFDDDDMAELAHSIREIGVLQPVVVRSVAADDQDGTNEETPFELIMGERRWRAAQQAGLDTIPAIIKDTSDDDLLRDALLENLHRSQLNPLEEAAAYQQLLDDFGCTHEELAGRIGRSRPQISNMLRLLRLPPLVARRVAAGVLSAGHARALLALPDAAAMERMAQRIVAEGLSVRSVEEMVALGGDEAPKTRSAPRPGDRHPQLDDLAAQLSDRFDTRVNISLGKRKGRLTVEFASVEDLHRIVDILAPDDHRG